MADKYDIELTDGAPLTTIEALEVDGGTSTGRNILVVDTTGGAGTNFFEISGDLTARYVAGFTFEVVGSASTDGPYTVVGAGSSFVGGNTRIQVNQNILQTIFLPQDETNFDGAGSNGTFTGGAGYNIGDVITLTNGTEITVDLVAAGLVTEFSVTGGGAGVENGVLINQFVVVPAGGAGFTLTPDSNNLKVGLPLGSTRYDLLDIGGTNTRNAPVELPGRGVVNYGEFILEDLLHMTEHFASAEGAPGIPDFTLVPNRLESPLVGQLWYNRTNESLYRFVGPDPAVDWALGAAMGICDADNDTCVKTEESPDEDIIRFQTGDTPAGYAAQVDIMTLASSGWNVSMGTANISATVGAPISLTAGKGGLTGDGGLALLSAGDGGMTSGAGGDATLQAGSADGGGLGGAASVLAGAGASAGGAANLTAGPAGGVGAGGAVNIDAGAGGGTSGFGGAVNITSGAAATSGNGGDIDILAGAGADGFRGGDVVITSGTGLTTGAGGEIDLVAGDGGATSGNGGDVRIDGGNAPTEGNGGEVVITGGDGAGTGFLTFGGRIKLDSGASGADSNGAPITLTAGDAGAGAYQVGGSLYGISGAGSGGGFGGPIGFLGGDGGATGSGADIMLYAGDGGATSGDGGVVRVEGGLSSDGLGGTIEIEAGAGGLTGAGGAVDINAGDGGATGNGGTAQLAGGAGGGTSGNGGTLSLQGGGSTSGAGGGVSLAAGDSTGAYAGSSVNISSGDAGTGVGGVIDLTAGDGAGAVGTGGAIDLNAGDGGSAGAGGGAINIDGGRGAATGGGGQVNIDGGDGGATSGQGGNVFIRGGSATDGSGGSGLFGAGDGAGSDRYGGTLTLASGSSTGTRDGGPINIAAGDGGATGDGGVINLTPGDHTAGSVGVININPPGDGAGETGELRFLELDASGSAYVGFKSPDDLTGGAGAQTYVLPPSDGNVGEALLTDGSANLSFGVPIGAGRFELSFVHADLQAGVIVDVSDDKLGADATGLVGGTTYTADITVDGGVVQTISILGSSALTYTTLLAELNADTTGATWTLAGGNLLVTSDTVGGATDVTVVVGIGADPLFDPATPLTGFVTIILGTQFLLAVNHGLATLTGLATSFYHVSIYNQVNELSFIGAVYAVDNDNLQLKLTAAVAADPTSDLDGTWTVVVSQ